MYCTSHAKPNYPFDSLRANSAFQKGTVQYPDVVVEKNHSRVEPRRTLGYVAYTCVCRGVDSSSKRDKTVRRSAVADDTITRNVAMPCVQKKYIE